MATKAKPKTATPQDPPPGEAPVVADLFEGRLVECYEFILDKCGENPDLGTPALIGPTRWGKTHFINKYGERRGRRVITAYMQTLEPEDLQGYPGKHDVNGRPRAFFTPPGILEDWLLDKLEDPEYDGSDTLLFLDELDKAERYKLTPCLSTLSPFEPRMGTVRLPKRLLRVVAMNEPKSPLEDALLGRMLFLPFPPGVEMAHRQFTSLRYIAETLWKEVPPVAFPEGRPSAPGCLHVVEEWQKCHWKEFLSSRTLQRYIVNGVFPEKEAAVVLSMLAERPPLPGCEWAGAVRPQELKAYFVDVFNALDQEGRTDVAAILSQRGNDDPTGEMTKALEELLHSPELLAKVGPIGAAK